MGRAEQALGMGEGMDPLGSWEKCSKQWSRPGSTPQGWDQQSSLESRTCGQRGGQIKLGGWSLALMLIAGHSGRYSLTHQNLKLPPLSPSCIKN